MLHPLGHPAIERLAVEPDEASMTDERQLQPGDLVIQRVSGHAEVPRGRVDVEPTWGDRRVGCGQISGVFDDDGSYNVSLFHERNSCGKCRGCCRRAAGLA
jgi:hypothetical protein